MVDTKTFVVDAYPDGIKNEKTGAGVLALPHAVAWLGWVAGPIVLVIFYLISILTSRLLADAYEVNGVENGSYHLAVRNILGAYYGMGVSFFQLLNIFLITVAYTITSATSMVAIAKMACSADGTTDCFSKSWQMSILFGASQLVLSQIPSLESAWWVSSLGAFTSITYSAIALGLGCKQAGAHAGTIGGIPANPANKVFGVMSSLGAVAFAYSFAIILLEIQDTLRQPPKASRTMKPAATIGISMSFTVYFAVAVVNYAAFGNSVSPFILNAFTGPAWVLYMGHACIILHIVSAYQVYAQPMYNTLESHIKAWMVRRAAQRGDHRLEEQAVAARVMSARMRGEAGALERAMEVGVFKQEEESKEVADPHSEEAAGKNGGHQPSTLRRVSTATARRLQLAARPSSMYRVSTGFANETVPLNEEHFLLPLWQRIIVRSLYVVIATLFACVMPFFDDMAGLVGALSFFPLSIFFPMRCWRRLYRPTGYFSWLLWVLEIGMGIVSLAATVASIRGIIKNWSNYKIFGDA